MTRRPRLGDTLLAAAFAAAELVEVLAVAYVGGSAAARAAAALVVTLPLAWRRSAPASALLLIVAGGALWPMLGLRSGETLIPILTLFVAAYSAGRDLPQRSSVVALALAAPLAWLRPALDRLLDVDRGSPGEFLFVTLVMGAAWSAGITLRERIDEVSTLDERARELQRDRDERARMAVAEERARIARELHDVIGHAISLIVVQAGAVRTRLTADQAAERETLEAAERTGRQALDEMRRLVLVLRDRGTPGTGPQPGVHELQQLIDDARAGDVNVELETRGDLDDLAPGPSLAAYRIVQEALTNVRKHAAAGHALVRLERLDSEIVIEVTDDGRGGEPQDIGHGLIGIRERVQVYGGSVEVGTAAGGGFRVCARLECRT